MSLLALLLAAQAPADPPAFATAPVTPEMAVAAVDECAWQLRAAAFDHRRLTDAGWVDVIRSDGDEAVIRGYRHRDNMILLHLFDNANESDKCAVMAPTGMGLSLDSMRSALAGRLGARPRRRDSQTMWELDDLRVVLRPMVSAGVLVELSPRRR